MKPPFLKYPNRARAWTTRADNTRPDTSTPKTQTFGTQRPQTEAPPEMGINNRTWGKINKITRGGVVFNVLKVCSYHPGAFVLLRRVLRHVQILSDNIVVLVSSECAHMCDSLSTRKMGQRGGAGRRSTHARRGGERQRGNRRFISCTRWHRYERLEQNNRILQASMCHLPLIVVIYSVRREALTTLWVAP